jgi:hypothetical protein
MIVGLTGYRCVGKSTIADLLVERFGFTKLHAFSPGKVMLMAYYQYLGIDTETSYRLLYGDLKDVPHPLIPGDGLSRTVMEKLGYNMGVNMGPEYTLGAALAHSRMVNPEAKFVVESVVYEAPMLLDAGAMLVRVMRPQASGKVAGQHTDEAVASIRTHYVLDNSKDGLDEVAEQLSFMMEQFEGLHR